MPLDPRPLTLEAWGLGLERPKTGVRPLGCHELSMITPRAPRAVHHALGHRGPQSRPVPRSSCCTWNIGVDQLNGIGLFAHHAFSF